MPCSITIYVDKKTTVISVFIYAKEIAYVNPDIAPKFIKLNVFSQCPLKLQWWFENLIFIYLESKLQMTALSEMVLAKPNNAPKKKKKRFEITFKHM